MSDYDKKGYVYGHFSDNKQDIIFKDLSGYPQGWHVVNSVGWRMIDQNLINPEIKFNKIQVLYVLTISLWMSILLYLTTKIIIELIKHAVDKTILGYYLLAASCIAALAIYVLLFIGMLRYGYANYVGLITILGSLVLLLIKSLKIDRNQELVLIVLATSLFVSSLSIIWLLAFLIGYIILAFLVLGYKLSDLKQSLARHWKLCIVSFGILALGISQVFIQISFSEKKNHILEDAGISSISPVLISLAIIGSLVLLTRYKGKINYILGGLMSGTLIMSGGIYLYQLTTIGKAVYFSTKLGQITLYFSLIMALTLVILVVNSLKMSKSARFILIVSIFIGIPFFTQSNIPELRIIKPGNWKLSEYTSSQLIANKHSSPDAFFVIRKNLDYEEDLTSTYMMTVLSRTYGICEQLTIQGLLTNDESKITQGIQTCSQEKPVFVYTSPSTSESFAMAMKSLPNVSVIATN